MQTDIHALVILYVDRDVVRQMQWLAVLCFQTLEISPYQIVGLARGNPLGEFADMIGRQLPLGFLVTGAADPDLLSIDGAIVRSPDRSEDQSIAIGWFQFLRRWSCKGWRHDRQIQSAEKANKQDVDGRQALERNCDAGSTSHPRLPPPLLPPIPRSRTRPPSTPVDWSSPLRSRCRTPGRRASRPRVPVPLPRPDWFRTRDQAP